jgi:hypothetical protein
MNIPKACEAAVYTVLNAYAGYAAGQLIRCWHNLEQSDNWDDAVDKIAPYVDIVFSPESAGEDQYSMQSQGAVVCGTKASDDRDHTAIADLYEKTHDVLRDVFRGFLRGGTPAQVARYTAFETKLLADLSGGITLGGVSFAEPVSPESTTGYNETGIGFVVHFMYA